MITSSSKQEKNNCTSQSISVILRGGFVNNEKFFTQKYDDTLLLFNVQIKNEFLRVNHPPKLKHLNEGLNFFCL